MFMHRLCALVAVFLFPSFVAAETAAQELASADLDAYARKLLAEWHAPGVAIAVVKDDKLVLARGYGVRETGKPEPVGEHTVFAIASCTKAFTSAALAILVDEGKVRWDDKVTRYLPDFQLYDPYVTRELTVRDLLCHRSGLGTFAGDLLWYNTTYDRNEVLRRVRFLRPVSSFRSSYGYQNIMFLAAGQIVPAATGKSWDEFVRERIFMPIGMSTAVTSSKGISAGADVATPHTVKFEKPIAIPRYDSDSIGPAASVHAGVDDLAKWMRLQLGMGEFEGKRVYSAAQARAMWTPQNALHQLPDPGTPSPTHLRAYALGWQVADYNGRLRVEHGGSIDGMFSQVILLPELKAGVFVVTNSDTPVAALLAGRAVDALLGVTAKDRGDELLNRYRTRDRIRKQQAERMDGNRDKTSKPSLPIEKYAGNYGGDLYGDVAVEHENGKLVLKFRPTPTFVADLDHWQYDTFRVKWRTLKPYIPDGWATFVLDRRGRPAELKVDCPNDDFDFTELELKRR
jgi:CubicO group peptidase (beta-lactamase class C family)